MSDSSLLRCVLSAKVLTALLWLWPVPVAAQQERAPLTPCLAVAADGEPIEPRQSLPSSKQLTVAFHLKPEEKFTTLHSRWLALGMADDGSDIVVAENDLPLMGQREGWLRLTLQQDAPVGRYRLETRADDQPWHTVEFDVTPAPELDKEVAPRDLMPLSPARLEYQLVIKPGPGTKIDLPGAEKQADGSLRATFAMVIGEKDEHGTRFSVYTNDRLNAQMWVTLEDQGLVMVRRMTDGKEEEVDPPVLMHPLPPRLEDRVEWTASLDGNEYQLQLIGPLPIRTGSQEQLGYLIFGRREVVIGEPGTSAARGKETVERYCVPGVGLVREVRANVLGGALTSRTEITLTNAAAKQQLAESGAPGTQGPSAETAKAEKSKEKTEAADARAPQQDDKPYEIVQDPQMKGRLGRLQVDLPDEAQTSDTRLAVYKLDEEKEISSGYGEREFELPPGQYELGINGKRVDVEIKSAHVTTPDCGVLRIHAGDNTAIRVIDTDGETVLFSGYGSRDVALPPGTYSVEVSGVRDSIKIEDDKVTEF